MRFGRTAAKPKMLLVPVVIEENERWRMKADGGMVPLAGIEPALLAELDFESSASTSSATGAFASSDPKETQDGPVLAKRADYNGQGERVNPRGCDFVRPRQALPQAIRPCREALKARRFRTEALSCFGY